jgi:hypothetical protein
MKRTLCELAFVFLCAGVLAIAAGIRSARSVRDHTWRTA